MIRCVCFWEVNIEISYNLNWLPLKWALFTRFLKKQYCWKFWGELGSQPFYCLSNGLGDVLDNPLSVKFMYIYACVVN